MLNKLKKCTAKVIRILTTAPVFAALLCTLLYVLVPNSFASPLHYVLALGYLSVLPVLAYPISAAIPALRRKGRDGQRNLAIVLSICGYLGGFLTALLLDGTPTECVLFGTYLCSGTLLALCTVFHFKASGHACGCSGPNAMLSLFVSPWFMLGYLLLTPIFWASRKLGRHSVPQLLVGTAIPVLALFANYAMFIR